MDISQSLYAIIAGVILVLAVAIWGAVRLRNRGASARIEPGMGTKSAGEDLVSRTLGPSIADAVPPPALDVVTETKPETPPEPVSKPPDGAIEQGYKGFKIHLREKQPGLWVASIADSTPRTRKRSAEERKGSVTHEYYQLPAALAEAKIMIDRRLAMRR